MKIYPKRKTQILLSITIVVLLTAFLTANFAWKKEQEKKNLSVWNQVFVDDPFSLDDGSTKMDFGAYPFYGDSYGPYQEKDIHNGNYDIWYDERGFQHHRWKEGYTELRYDGIKCIEHTDASETVLVYDGSYLPYDKQEVGSDTMDEFFNKMAAGIPVSEIEDEQGYVKGYYEPGATREPKPQGTADRYYAGFCWTMEPGMCYYGGSTLQLNSVTGNPTLQIHITQSQTGKSYLVLKDNKTGDKVRILASETENGWHGTLHLGSIPTAYYSIGIENASSETIIYHGMHGVR